MILNQTLMALLRDVEDMLDGYVTCDYEVEIVGGRLFISFNRNIGDLLHSRLARYNIKIELVDISDNSEFEKGGMP